jgi:GAF domain-containing protein
MTVEEFTRQLAASLAGAEPAARLETAAREIGAFFGVEPHEVAFFTVDERHHRIVFRWPPSLASTGHIPLKGVNSLVAKTAVERRSFIDNTFAASRHLYILEHFLADKKERIAVQKVMSVPIVAGEATAGVVQLARKGGTPEEAGADFTGSDLDNLELIATVLGKAGI